MQLVCVYTQYKLTALVENQLIISICVYLCVLQSVLLVYFYASTVYLGHQCFQLCAFCSGLFQLFQVSGLNQNFRSTFFISAENVTGIFFLHICLCMFGGRRGCQVLWDEVTLVSHHVSTKLSLGCLEGQSMILLSKSSLQAPRAF